MYLWESPVCAPEWDLKRKRSSDCALKEFIFTLCSLRRLSAKELMLLNYGSGEDSWESFVLRGDQTSQSVDSGNPVDSGNQPWIFIGRTDAEVEIPIFWPPDVKSWLIWKDPDAGKDWGQEEKGTTEDEMVGWHHWLNGHGFGWTPGVDSTEKLNWTELIVIIV